MGLRQLQLIEVVPETGAHEFYVHLQRPERKPIEADVDVDSFYRKRKSLLHRVNSEAAANSIEAFRILSELKCAHTRIDEQQRAIETSRSELNQAIGCIDEQKKELTAMEKVASDTRDKSYERIKELEAVIVGMVNSKSWRLTTPLRAIAFRLRQ